MANKDRICIETFHRNELSIGEANRQALKNDAYHWAVLVRPKDIDSLATCTSFDVTNGSRQIPASSGRNEETNPDGDWWFRRRHPVNPLATGQFLTAVVIGKLPENVLIKDVESVLESVPLPRKNYTPKESCSTWTVLAIIALQQAGYADQLDVDGIMRAAVLESNEVMKHGPPKSKKKRFIDSMGRA
ncbi:hypothetical protein B0A50_06534 [Salinomyces thailandicus]|uniref:Uncharacterized protein n=1 Tax=Salinomyces thailandicus TaxID=706561 RepID=A0A4U0TNV3_9PEZI|nr:hypothetical protein B0A50_06534 [Salinomyces thailandica]